MAKENDPCVSWSFEELIQAQKDDKEINCIIQWFEESTEPPDWDKVTMKSACVKTLWSMWPRLRIQDGILKRRFEDVNGKDENWQIILPRVYRIEFMRIAHSGMTGGHMGYRKTAAAIQRRAYWPTWSSDLTQFIKACEPCARYHRGAIHHQVLLQTPMIGEPWERVSIDITGPHPKSTRSKQYILTLVDHFSKWAEAIPLVNHTAPSVAKALMTHVFSRFGVPRQILTDRGPEFESELFSQLMRWMEIDKLRCTPYKPSTNSMVERFHRTLNSMLGKMVNENQRNWDEQLPLVLAAYRASQHKSTGYSPNKLFLGHETRMPLDLIMGVPSVNPETEQSVDKFVQKMQEDAEQCYEIARKQLQVAAERRKKSYDIKVRKTEFKVGDWVWYWYPRRYQKKSPKWQQMYTGPYLITRFIGPVNYVLQKSIKSKPFVVHADKLKRCFGSTPVSWLNPEIHKVDERSPVMSKQHQNNEDMNKQDDKVDTVPIYSHSKSKEQDKQDDVEQVESGNNRPKRLNRKVPKHFDGFMM
jgi:transposase InsO family protein